MGKENEQHGKLEWRVNVPDGISKALEPMPISESRLCRGFRGLTLRIRRFFEKAWSIAVSEPKKVIHCLKVGIALTIVSLFYYTRPLYDGVGGNAMWAVMTVVVVFEYTVGATLCKCVNRAIGTLLAGSLGVGVHWIAQKSGEDFEPVILQASVFLLAAAATFSRFIPSIKARFDYGAMIFILTFSLVSVSSYRVDKLFPLAYERLSTVAIGTSLCILTSMLLCPVWAGKELHHLIVNNMEKLADSLNGCIMDYFETDENVNAKNEDSNKRLQGYRCALNSKATEESMAMFARWEPAHGHFNFLHPWKGYLKVGAAMRSCAYCVETLNASINSENEVPDFLKNHFSTFCTRLSSHSSDALKELALSINTMTKSTKIDLTIQEMNCAVQDLNNAMKSLSEQPVTLPAAPAVESHNSSKETTASPTIIVPLMDIVPLVTVASLLIETAARIEEIAKAANELANKAEFGSASDQKPKQGQNLTSQSLNQLSGDNQEAVKMKTLERV